MPTHPHPLATMAPRAAGALTLAALAALLPAAPVRGAPAPAAAPATSTGTTPARGAAGGGAAPCGAPMCPPRGTAPKRLRLG